jgi:hypothetical protein
METSIPALLMTAILMITTVVLARSGYASLDELGQSWQMMEERLNEQTHTELTATQTSVDESRANLTVMLRNDGQTKWADWAAWTSSSMVLGVRQPLCALDPLHVEARSTPGPSAQSRMTSSRRMCSIGRDIGCGS